MTASICTSSAAEPGAGGYAPDDLFQNVYIDGNTSTNFVGHQIDDDAGWWCGPSWCRWSDATMVEAAGGRPRNYKIARTNSYAYGAGNSGSITVNSSNPRMTVTGEYSFPTGGEMFDKMGATTGWTWGNVAKTCVDHNRYGGWKAICQDWVKDMHADFGDAGAPVFRWYGSTVMLAGILWGKAYGSGEEYAVIGAMWNIKQDHSPEAGVITVDGS